MKRRKNQTKNQIWGGLLILVGVGLFITVAQGIGGFLIIGGLILALKDALRAPTKEEVEAKKRGLGKGQVHSYNEEMKEAVRLHPANCTCGYCVEDRRQKFQKRKADAEKKARMRNANKD